MLLQIYLGLLLKDLKYTLSRMINGFLSIALKFKNSVFCHLSKCHQITGVINCTNNHHTDLKLSKDE